MELDPDRQASLDQVRHVKACELRTYDIAQAHLARIAARAADAPPGEEDAAGKALERALRLSGAAANRILRLTTLEAKLAGWTPPPKARQAAEKIPDEALRITRPPDHRITWALGHLNDATENVDPRTRPILRRRLSEEFHDHLAAHDPGPDQPGPVAEALWMLRDKYNLPLKTDHVHDTLLSDDPVRWRAMIAHRLGPKALDDWQYTWPFNRPSDWKLMKNS